MRTSDRAIAGGDAPHNSRNQPRLRSPSLMTATSPQGRTPSCRSSPSSYRSISLNQYRDSQLLRGHGESVSRWTDNVVLEARQAENALHRIPCSSGYLTTRPNARARIGIVCAVYRASASVDVDPRSTTIKPTTSVRGLHHDRTDLFSGFQCPNRVVDVVERKPASDHRAELEAARFDEFDDQRNVPECLCPAVEAAA